MRKGICTGILLLLMTSVAGFCGELEDLFARVEALKLERQGYTLCRELTPAQQAYAREHMEEANSKKVYRFRDKTLNVVADHATHRVLVMFEQYEQLGQPGVQNLVGDLFMAYGEPTVSAHDRVVYWAWGQKEKFTADQYKMAKEKNKGLEILATVKLNSEIPIMEKSDEDGKGSAYYTISSDPLLRFFKDE